MKKYYIKINKNPPEYWMKYEVHYYGRATPYGSEEPDWRILLFDKRKNIIKCVKTLENLGYIKRDLLSEAISKGIKKMWNPPPNYFHHRNFPHDFHKNNPKLIIGCLT